MTKQDVVASGGQPFLLDKSWNSCLEVDWTFQHTFRNVTSLCLVWACGSVNWLTSLVSFSHPLACCHLIEDISELFSCSYADTKALGEGKRKQCTSRQDPDCLLGIQALPAAEQHCDLGKLLYHSVPPFPMEIIPLTVEWVYCEDSTLSIVLVYECSLSVLSVVRE